MMARRLGAISVIIIVFLLSTTLQSQSGQLHPSSSFLGTNGEERLAYWCSSGDINGDGYQDILLGASHSSRNGWDSGSVYLLLGGFGNNWGMNFYLNSADAIFVGDRLDNVGYPVDGGGDINGDGLDDILIGAAEGRDEAGPEPGRVFLVFGRSSANWGRDVRLRDMADVTFVGENAYDQTGLSLSIIGDINKDGCDDFIIAAPFNDDGSQDGGKVFLFLGKRGWPKEVNVSSANASFVSRNKNFWAGYSVSGVGDVNGDGIPDFAIASPNWNGTIYLIFGRNSVNWGQNFDLDNADVIFHGEGGGDKAGELVTNATDANGDGLSDILIGAPGNDSGGTNAGKVYLFFGRRNWKHDIWLSEANASFIGEGSGDAIGMMKSVAGNGDVNNDGISDILIGAPHNGQSGDEAGKIYLIYGQKNGWSTNFNLRNASGYFCG